MNSTEPPIFGPNGVVLNSGAMAGHTSEPEDNATQQSSESRYWRWFGIWWLLTLGLSQAKLLAQNGWLIPSSWTNSLNLLSAGAMVFFIFGGVTLMTVVGIVQYGRD